MATNIFFSHFCVDRRSCKIYQTDKRCSYKYFWSPKRKSWLKQAKNCWASLWFLIPCWKISSYNLWIMVFSWWKVSSRIRQLQHKQINVGFGWDIFKTVTVFPVIPVRFHSDCFRKMTSCKQKQLELLSVFSNIFPC